MAKRIFVPAFVKKNGQKVKGHWKMDPRNKKPGESNPTAKKIQSKVTSKVVSPVSKPAGAEFASKVEDKMEEIKKELASKYPPIELQGEDRRPGYKGKWEQISQTGSPTAQTGKWSKRISSKDWNSRNEAKTNNAMKRAANMSKSDQDFQQDMINRRYGGKPNEADYLRYKKALASSNQPKITHNSDHPRDPVAELFPVSKEHYFRRGQSGKAPVKETPSVPKKSKKKSWFLSIFSRK